MRNRLLATLDHVTLAANVVGSLLILSLVVLITADVAGRNLLGAPLSGVPELVSLSIVAIVFLQAPQALKAGRMTRSDGVIDVLHARFPNLARWLETVFDLVGIAVLSAILYAHWPMMTRAWTRGDFVGAVGDFTAPTWPVKAMLALGCILLALQFGARIVRRFVR
ncbi:TRAP transporter small permease subunit [uncultured Sulfitobacter sp.]|uniref:TRAP transporter small permease subunit n=1 Tax=uncultured Sulfitobacter sp. TaxID=191468 RepID=UPI0026051190|nr:TRAP transporter small permease [uncultured Sulfitobacter sp.]